MALGAVCLDDAPGHRCPAILRSLSLGLRAGHVLRLFATTAKKAPLAGRSFVCAGDVLDLADHYVWGVPGRYPVRLYLRHVFGLVCVGKDRGSLDSACFCWLLGCDRLHFVPNPKNFEKNMQFCKKIICICKKIGKSSEKE